MSVPLPLVEGVLINGVQLINGGSHYDIIGNTENPYSTSDYIRGMRLQKSISGSGSAVGASTVINFHQENSNNGNSWQFKPEGSRAANSDKKNVLICTSKFVRLKQQENFRNVLLLVQSCSTGHIVDSISRSHFRPMMQTQGATRALGNVSERILSAVNPSY